MSIDSLINNIKKGDVADSNNTFNRIMADKMNAALDLQKQDVASTMYGLEDDEVEATEEEEVESDEEV